MAKIGANVSTMDLQADLIENTRQVANKMGWRIDARVMDLTALDYDDETFDVVISVSVLEHMNDELKIIGIKEMARVLKPGGIMGITFDFGVSVGQGHTPVQTVADIVRLFMKPSGLSLYGDGKLYNTMNPETTATKFQYRRFPFIAGAFLERLLRTILRRPLRKYTFYSLFLQRPNG
jgi:ubiquinone/menaquinone biosynthesis C-methylase UbiE